MVNLQVTDAHAAHAELTGRGVRFVRAPEREDWSELVATLEDPDGNLLQLLGIISLTQNAHSMYRPW